jgi:hypothetical protein
MKLFSTLVLASLVFSAHASATCYETYEKWKPVGQDRTRSQANKLSLAGLMGPAAVAIAMGPILGPGVVIVGGLGFSLGPEGSKHISSLERANQLVNWAYSNSSVHQMNWNQKYDKKPIEVAVYERFLKQYLKGKHAQEPKELRKSLIKADMQIYHPEVEAELKMLVRMGVENNVFCSEDENQEPAGHKAIVKYLENNFQQF